MISDADLDTLFRAARSQNGWTTKPVSDQQLHNLYELMKWGPTSANCSPVRILFLRTQAAKDKLRPLLSPGNVAKTDAAPITAIIGYDTEFHRHLSRLFPHNPTVKDNFRGPKNTAHCEQTAFRNGTLQGGYFMLAARALGLDCGPMSGFDAQAIDHAFWAGTSVRTNFLCNLGYGDPVKLFPRHPRLDFGEVCKIL